MRSYGALAAILLTALSVAGQEQRRNREQPPPATQGEPAAPAHRAPPPEEKTSVTRHTARVGGQQISYTATTGTYVMKAEDGTPKASFFYVAYTKDDSGDVV